jgi:ankyrin repeat protein
MACQEGHEKIVKILIDNGADVNVGFDDLSCLFVACRENHEADRYACSSLVVFFLFLDNLSSLFFCKTESLSKSIVAISKNPS